MVLGDFSFREFADQVYIPLADALSWIAFGQVRDSNEWDFTGEQGLPHDGARGDDVRPDREAEAGDAQAERGEHIEEGRGVDLIVRAWLKLREAVEAGKVEVRGRYTEAYSSRQASLADVSSLNGAVLAAFSQFDLATGGIRRKPLGNPEVIWPDHEWALDREWESFTGDRRATDGYLRVEVERNTLLNAFPSSEATDKSTAATSSKARAERQCQDWLTRQFSADPERQRTKTDFKKAALEEFGPRLSGWGFIRAWNAVAPQSGRSRPGRKS